MSECYEALPCLSLFFEHIAKLPIEQIVNRMHLDEYY